MKRQAWLIGLGVALASSAAFAEPSACGLPDISSASELHRFLSLRAVDIIRLAAQSSTGLTKLVAPSARFDLGAGDVNRPLGTGLDGAHALAQAMKADTYRFPGWNYMDMPVDPCSKQEIEVEFVDSQEKNVSSVKFTFEGGRVVDASGWVRSFETGRL